MSKFSLYPLKHSRNDPSSQYPSLWLLPANWPPSPLLLSPPPSPMLSSSLLPTAHSDLPPGSFSRSVSVQSRRQLPRWFSSWCTLSQWRGRASPLPPPSHMPAPAAYILPRPLLKPVCEQIQKLHQNVQRRHQEEKWCSDAGWLGHCQSDSISYQLKMQQSCTPEQLQLCVSLQLSHLALANNKGGFLIQL